MKFTRVFPFIFMALLFAPLVHAADLNATQVVLQDGKQAWLTGGHLEIIGADGKRTRATAGFYNTQDGQRITVTRAGNAILKNPGDDVSLNPQPLPPKDSQRRKVGLSKPGDDVSLNPQPLPPKDLGARSKATTGQLGDDVSLNPQPLPPKDTTARKRITKNFGTGAASVTLIDGTSARIAGSALMISSPQGETRAKTGRYTTIEGRVIVVNAQGEISD